MTRSQEVQVTQRPQIFHHLLSVSLLLAMFRMSLVPSTIMTQWNTQNQQSFARFNTWAHLPKQALQRPQVEQERGCFFPTETIWWYSTYPNAKGSASLFFLQVWGHDNRILQHGSSLLLSMKLPRFVLEDKKEQTSSKRKIALSSLPLYQAVRHPLCFSSWLILCFSALSEEMPGWIMSEPEYDLPHPVLGVRLPSLNPHCTGASTSELEQLCGL